MAASMVFAGFRILFLGVVDLSKFEGQNFELGKMIDRYSYYGSTYGKLLCFHLSYLMRAVGFVSNSCCGCSMWHGIPNCLRVRSTLWTA